MGGSSLRVIAAWLECFPEKQSWCRNEQVCQGRISVKRVEGSSGLDTMLYITKNTFTLLPFMHSPASQDNTAVQKPILGVSSNSADLHRARLLLLRPNQWSSVGNWNGMLQMMYSDADLTLVNSELLWRHRSSANVFDTRFTRAKQYTQRSINWSMRN